jgi:hypothetical protein
MNLVKNFFRKHFHLFILVVIVFLVAIFNYKSGFWLAGWDNYLPELNFFSSFQRSFCGVWQEYRGLGLLDGMAHTANLVHTLFIFFFSIFLPVNRLRYFFHTLMFLTGGTGMYKLFKDIDKKEDDGGKRKIAIAGALFYLLNIGTIQMFYVPLEVFSVHFAFLPWLVLVFFRFLQKPSKKNILRLALVNLLATPQAYVPTVFAVYLGILLVISLMRLLVEETVMKEAKKIMVVFGVIFIINAFWLFPYTYGVFSGNPEITTNSKINQMANEEIFLRNKFFGGFSSVALIRGFYLNYTDLFSTNKTDFMMKPWREHLNQPAVKVISWLFFGLMLLGLAAAIRRKEKKYYPFVCLLLISFCMLGIDTPVISIPFNLFSEYIPFFKEAFRFTFTKFSILYVFGYSIFLARGLGEILGRLGKLGSLGLMGLFSGALIFYSLPIFQGELFYKNLRVAIPSEYFSLIDFFNQENFNKRLVILPQPNFWGWTYYNWGFRGSGFIWQALPQASLDGAFLPWSAENENFYWEISRAIYSEDRKLLESVLEKYQINWLVVDENIITAGSPKSLYIDEIKEMLAGSEKIQKIREFGKIKVYQVNLETPVKDFVFFAENLPTVGPEYKWNDEDIAYREIGDYISATSDKQQVKSKILYPFRSLFTGRKQEELEFGVEDHNDYFAFKTTIPEELRNYPLVYQEYPYELVFWDKNLASRSAEPKIRMNENILEVRWPKEKGFYTYDSLDDPEFFNREVHSCNPFNTGVMKRQRINEKGRDRLRFTSFGSSNCLDIDLPLFTHKIGYLVKVESRHIKGREMLFSVINKNSRRNEVELYLSNSKLKSQNEKTENQNQEISYFIIPPMESDGQGYILHFDNISIGRQEAINDLGRIEVYPIPYRFLKSLRISSGQANPPKTERVRQASLKEVLKVEHPNPSFYKIFLLTNYNQKFATNLVLSQTYNPGWLALKMEARSWKPEILDHFLVNNWENGWEIKLKSQNSKQEDFSQLSTIYIFFWPQLMEYAGFALLGGVGLWLAVKKD